METPEPVDFMERPQRRRKSKGPQKIVVRGFSMPVTLLEDVERLILSDRKNPIHEGNFSRLMRWIIRKELAKDAKPPEETATSPTP